MVMLMHRGLIHGEVYTGLCASMNKRCCCCCYTEGGLQTGGLINRGSLIYRGYICLCTRGLYTGGGLYAREACTQRGVYTEGIYTGGTLMHRGLTDRGEVYTQGRSGLLMGWNTITAKELIWLIRNLYCDQFTIPSRPRSVEEVFDGWS